MREMYLYGAVAVVALGVTSGGKAATVEVDGTAVKTLSAAIAQAEAADDGPHVINIKTDALTTPDGPIIISEPVTVNGDGDGNGKKCDILVDIAAIRQAPEGADLLGKAYIKLHAEGKVILNDLMIHPDTDGTKASDTELVDAMRVFCPAKRNGVGEYELNRVFISGSDANNKYVSLETAEDLYAKPGLKMWSRQSPMGNRGIIHCANRKAKGQSEEKGDYVLTLNQCQLGLGRGVALNFTASSNQHKVNGGLYGHCGTDAIRVAGNTLGITGTADNRVKIVRAANFTGSGAAGRPVSFTPKAQISSFEFVDVMPLPGVKEDVSTLVPKAMGVEPREVRVITNEARMAMAIKGEKLPDVEPFTGWLTPEAAWAQAQSKKQNMVLFFYSPDVSAAAQLNKLMESDMDAATFLASNAVGRVEVNSAAGNAVAKKYGVFKVPTLMIVAPDAKSFKKITPGSAGDWKAIEKELTAK